MGLRRWMITILVVLVILNLTMPCLAWTASKRLVTIGDMFFGGEFAKWKTTATLFHSQNQAVADTEALAIGFPVLDGSTSIAPSIAQTAQGTASATDTGFFQASWCFTSLEDPGGYALTPNVGSWHPMRSTDMVGSGLIWPYMEEAASTGASTGGAAMKFSPVINTTPDTGNVKLPTGNNTPGNVALKGTNVTAGNTTAGAKNQTPTVSKTSGQKTPDTYKNMKKAEIQNLTGMDKMFRNANRKNTVPQSYKGTVDRPTVIAALDKPMDLIKPADKKRVINDSLNMTESGTDLRTLFWDL